jgi:hypothetical protein
MQIDKSRYYIIDNELHGGFCDYVVIIKPHVSKNGTLNWTVVFSKGDGYNAESDPIICNSLEKAFEIVENYTKQVKFDKLMEELAENMEK